jgi:hypothetical protein
MRRQESFETPLATAFRHWLPRRIRVKKYLDAATRVNLKYKMPTRAILLQVHQLTNHLQVLLSHVEQLKPGVSKVQQSHVAEIRKATKGAVAVIGKIQNLANIELEEHE